MYRKSKDLLPQMLHDKFGSNLGTLEGGEGKQFSWKPEILENA